MSNARRSYQACGLQVYIAGSGNEDLPLLELTIGSRFRIKSRGTFSRRMEGRTGTVIGFAQTKSAVRVLFDGQKHPQTLHRSYLQLIPDAVL